MSIHRLIETYLTRARDLEDHAQRLEKNPPSLRLSPRPYDTAALRREAMWWHAYAEALAKSA
jgi:hypothetical protein